MLQMRSAVAAEAGQMRRIRQVRAGWVVQMHQCLRTGQTLDLFAAAALADQTRQALDYRKSWRSCDLAGSPGHVTPIENDTVNEG